VKNAAWPAHAAPAGTYRQTTVHGPLLATAGSTCEELIRGTKCTNGISGNITHGWRDIHGHWRPNREAPDWPPIIVDATANLSMLPPDAVPSASWSSPLDPCCMAHFSRVSSVSTGWFSLATQGMLSQTELGVALNVQCDDILEWDDFQNLATYRGAVGDVFGTENCGETPCPTSHPLCLNGVCYIPRCALLKPFCQEITPRGVQSRLMCPLTCECNRPTSPLVLSAPKDGCPTSCTTSRALDAPGPNAYFAALDAMPCVDMPHTSGPFAAYIEQLASISEDEYWPAGERFEIRNIIAPALRRHGCSTVYGGVIGCGTAAHPDTNGISWKQLTYFCPVTCGCGAGQEHCPGTCNASATASLSESSRYAIYLDVENTLAFARTDTDLSDNVDFDELFRFASAEGLARPREQLLLLFNGTDTNGSGRLEMAEFKSLRQQLAGLVEGDETGSEVAGSSEADEEGTLEFAAADTDADVDAEGTLEFAAADTDATGSVDFDESLLFFSAQGLTLPREQLLLLFNGTDTNGSGRLEIAEFTSLRQQLAGLGEGDEKGSGEEGEVAGSSVEAGEED